MKNIHKEEICRRITEIRTTVFGSRGKSTFAKQLGISPSTYDYYENDRIPPADLLVAIADAGKVDLRWLITGEKSNNPAAQTNHPILQRAAELLATKPDSAAALNAFLDILCEAAEKFPATTPVPPAAPGQASEEPPSPAATPARESWIPILGRSAAGVPHFWPAGETEGITQLGELIERHALRCAHHRRPAQAGLAADAPQHVQLITLNTPESDLPAEYVAADEFKRRWPDAFAVRIDGESMAPDIRHGDLVLLSPTCPATDGQPAVIQLTDQIGVTCKLFRRAGLQVHLIPLNEQFAPQEFPAESLVWALRVLARIRPQ